MYERPLPIQHGAFLRIRQNRYTSTMNNEKQHLVDSKKALKHILDSYQSFLDTYEHLHKSHKEIVRKEIEKHTKKI